MPKTTYRLTAIRLHNLKKPGLHADGAGLYLKVLPSGSKSWVFRFMRAGKARYLGLGSQPRSIWPTPDHWRPKRASSCGWIRIRSRLRRKLGLRLASSCTKAMTFRDCAEAYMVSHEPSWKNAKHREQWRSTLRRYLTPSSGVFRAAITTEWSCRLSSRSGMQCPKPHRACEVASRSSLTGRRRAAFAQSKIRRAGADILPICFPSPRNLHVSNTTRHCRLLRCRHSWRLLLLSKA